MNNIEEIVIVGSGIRHLTQDVVNHYLLGNYVTIGPNYLNQDISYDYYFWTGSSFKVKVMQENKKLLPPKVKSIIVSTPLSQRNLIMDNYEKEFKRLKCEFYLKSPWKSYVGTGGSMGSRLFYYIMDQFPNMKNIIFLGCSALAGECNIKGSHNFIHEGITIKKVLINKNIISKWIHKLEVY